ncbi:hypothetical protein D3C79_841010 [compost metagenome]
MAAGDLRQQEHGVLVEVDNVKPVFFTMVFGWSTADHACAVNEDIHVAGQFQRLIKRSLQLAVIAQVCFDAEGFYAVCFSSLYGFFTAVQGNGYNICACFSEGQQNALTKTLGCSGYDCCFACQTE